MVKYGSDASTGPPIDSDQKSHKNAGDENPERGNWTNTSEYMLSMIGYAIGLGNIWRFPYLAYNNGGGAFLIPYMLMLIFCGLPLFFLEAAIGQFCSQSPINTWRAVPILQGAGFSVVIASLILAIYYNVIIAYSLYYMFASMQSPLPWSDCFSWADSNCSTTPEVYCNITGVLVASWTQTNNTCPSSNKISVPMQGPTEQYWDRVALQRSAGLDETGPVVWHLALCLLLSSIMVAAALIRGIKSSGKVVYFTATLPYVVILILLIRGVTLEGAVDGIQFFIGSQSNLTKLAEVELVGSAVSGPSFGVTYTFGGQNCRTWINTLSINCLWWRFFTQVWRSAATQTFYSLSVAMGGCTTLCSYNKFHNNMLVDSIVVSFVNHATSIFAGFAIFSVLGHMAHNYGTSVSNVVTEGFGLAFIAYPDALAKLAISPLWSTLFFFMLVTVGLDSQFTTIEVIITCLQDAFPEVLKSKRIHVTVVTNLVVYLLGLLCVTRAGIYWVSLMDHSVSSWVLLILGLTEIIGFCYIYGVNNFIKDVEMMLGGKSFCFWLWWRVCWFALSPCIIVLILLWSLITYTPPTYGGIQYPAWGLALSWCMVASVLIWIPLVATFKMLKAEGTFRQRLLSLCSPSETWHPFLVIHRGERYSEEQRIRRSRVNNY